MRTSRPRRRLLRRLLALLVGLVLVAAACSGGGDDGEAIDAGDTGSAEQDGGGAGDLPAVEFELADGGATTLGGVVDGRPLVVNFFASWCPPCRAEMPEFQAVHADLRGRVDFLGIAMQDTRQAAAALVEETGVEYPWGLDPDGRLYAELQAFSMPTTIFITADGDIAGRANGAVNEDQLRSMIEEHFEVTA